MRPAVLLAVTAALAGCERSSKAPLPTPGAIRPIATEHGLTLAVGRAPTWVELNAACYMAAIQMSGNTRPIDPIEKVRPGVEKALTSAGFDFERDVLTIGGLSCGTGTCIVIGVHVGSPEQPKKILDAAFAPTKVSEVEPGHFSATVTGTGGDRAVHIRFLPLDWTGVAVPTDARAATLRRATHVAFISSDDAGRPVPDPRALLADGDPAASRVRMLEAMSADPRGRCALGEIAAAPAFRPGFDLTTARFLVATPPRSGSDALAAMMAVERGLDIQVQLELSKAPSNPDVDGWVAEARGWIDAVAAQTPAPPALVQLLRTTVERAFRYDIVGQRVALSWKTERIAAEHLSSLERELGAMFGAKP